MIRAIVASTLCYPWVTNTVRQQVALGNGIHEAMRPVKMIVAEQSTTISPQN
jgi:hypothetical protein